MIEKTKVNLNELLAAMSEDKVDLACETQDCKTSMSWDWSATESKSRSNQSWSWSE